MQSLRDNPFDETPNYDFSDKISIDRGFVLAMLAKSWTLAGSSSAHLELNADFYMRKPF